MMYPFPTQKATHLMKKGACQLNASFERTEEVATHVSTVILEPEVEALGRARAFVTSVMQDPADHPVGRIGPTATLLGL